MANNKGLTIALVSTVVLILSSAVGCSALSSIPGSSKKTSEVSINVPSDIVSYVSSIPEISLAEPSIIITSRNESESSVAETVQTITLEEFVELVQEQIDEASISDSPFTLEIDYDENGLVYDYTTKDYYSGTNLEYLTQEINKLIERNSSLYSSALKELRSATGINYNITVIYHNSDDSIISEKFFSNI